MKARDKQILHEIKLKDKHEANINSKIDYKIKCIDTSIIALENTVSELRKNILRMRSALDAHINRQYAEIKVIEEDGEWGDYSGVFHVNDEDAKDIVLGKAEKHFERYFKNGHNHKNKELGLFLFSARSGRQLVKQMNTNKGDVE